MVFHLFEMIFHDSDKDTIIRQSTNSNRFKPGLFFSLWNTILSFYNGKVEILASTTRISQHDITQNMSVIGLTMSLKSLSSVNIVTKGAWCRVVACWCEDLWFLKSYSSSSLPHFFQFQVKSIVKSASSIVQHGATAATKHNARRRSSTRAHLLSLRSLLQELYDYPKKKIYLF